MFGKSLISLLTSTVVTLAIFPALAKSETPSNITFACEDNQGIPVTVAKNNKGTTQAIFHWKQVALPNQTIPQETCNLVTEKLNDYVNQSDDLSELWIQPGDIAHVPVICVERQPQNCEVVIFSFAPSSVPTSIAHNTLEQILDRKMLNENTYKYKEKQGFLVKINFSQLFDTTKDSSAYYQTNYQKMM